MTQYFEDFEAMSTGSPPTGFTRRMTDNNWTTHIQTAYSQKVIDWQNGGFGGGLSSVTHDTAGSVSGACEIVVEFRIPSLGYPQVLAGLYINASWPYSGYFLVLEAANTLSIQRWSANAAAATIGSNYTGLTISADTTYVARFGINGSGDLSARAWLGGSGEPGSPQITGNDTNISSGYIGPAASRYDALPRHLLVGIGTGGDAAPTSGGGGGGGGQPPRSMHQFRLRRAA